MQKSNFHIVTGGPGSGKTTLVEALKARGAIGVDEVGRQIIREQIAIGGNALHWGDRRMYAELMLSRSIFDYERHADTAGPVFFDRGIPELTGYCDLIGLPVPAHFEKAAEVYRYHRRIFVTPPWPEIFANDAERKQDFDEAMATYDAVCRACRRARYEIVEIPNTSVADRVTFVLSQVSATNAS